MNIETSTRKPMALRRRLLWPLAALLTAAGLSSTALAAYPDRPITLIVPWAAGGGTDATGRFVATLLERELKQLSTLSTVPAAAASLGTPRSLTPSPTATRLAL